MRRPSESYGSVFSGACECSAFEATVHIAGLVSLAGAASLAVSYAIVHTGAAAAAGVVLFLLFLSSSVVVEFTIVKRLAFARARL